MIQMESMPGMLADFQFPSAIVLARLADVVANNNVVYRMVQPTEQGTEVVSNNRMVNVVPYRRVYRFDGKDELNNFCNELLKRPLVMQPVVHIGRGIGSGNLACGLCYKDDKWVMMINQTHPKILGRLQIGLDAAKNAMARGQSCEIRFAFSEMVEKLYKETLTKSEQENAAQSLDLIKSYFRYADWEYGDLIIRYMGYAARFGRGGGLRDMSTLNLTFRFEDVMNEEISWKTLGTEFFPKPHLAPITEDEIRECLPSWTVNGVSPLENIGEQAPAANYSYSQAGRLYESFRKKKRRSRADMGDQAEGGAPTIRPTVTDGIELKVVERDDRGQWQEARGGRYTDQYPDQQQGYTDQYPDQQQGYTDQYPDQQQGYTDQYPDQQQGYSEATYDGRGDHGAVGPRHASHHWQGYTEDDGFYEKKGAKPKRPPQHDSHGHMYPEVKVNSRTAIKPGSDHHASAGPLPTSYPYANGPSASNSYADGPRGQVSSPYTNSPQESEAANPYALPSPSQDNHEYSSLQNQFTRLRIHGSDRSSHSETGSGIADSGISSDNDGHVRESSCDKPYPSAQKNGPGYPYAMDNHGFHDDEADVGEALRKHKELVAKMMGGGGQLQGGVKQNSGYEDSRQLRHQAANLHRDVGDYVGGYGSGPSHGKGGVPSPLALPGQHYDGRNPHHGHAAYSPSAHSPSAHSLNARSPRLPVEESFI